MAEPMLLIGKIDGINQCVLHFNFWNIHDNLCIHGTLLDPQQIDRDQELRPQSFMHPKYGIFALSKIHHFYFVQNQWSFPVAQRNSVVI